MPCRQHIRSTTLKSVPTKNRNCYSLFAHLSRIDLRITVIIQLWRVCFKLIIWMHNLTECLSDPEFVMSAQNAA
jgi:hypothetical protein